MYKLHSKLDYNIHSLGIVLKTLLTVYLYTILLYVLVCSSLHILITFLKVLTLLIIMV